MKTSYFTFGQSHVHRFNETILNKDCIVRITDRNPRKKMFDLFGDKFSFEYNIENLDVTYFPRRIFPISQDNLILPYTSFWHIREFKDGDHFASFLIDVLLVRGLEIGDVFIENFPLYYEEHGKYLIDVLNEERDLMDLETYPNFLKYETVRGWCYDTYNLLIEDHSNLASTFPLQILSIEGEFELVDSIEGLLETSK